MIFSFTEEQKYTMTAGGAANLPAATNLPPAPPSDNDLLLQSSDQSAIVDESDRTEDNRLTLQHTCAQSQKRIMGVCFVNDTVFLVFLLPASRFQ